MAGSDGKRKGKSGGYHYSGGCPGLRKRVDKEVDPCDTLRTRTGNPPAFALCLQSTSCNPIPGCAIDEMHIIRFERNGKFLNDASPHFILSPVEDVSDPIHPVTG